MKVRRFFYVRAPQGRVVHIQYGKTHSARLVKCGRHSEKGWLWTERGTHPICKQCDA